MAEKLQLHPTRRLKIAADPERSMTLPGWAYTDPAMLEREKRDIFAKTWHYAGAVSELQEAGDYITAKILDQTVIVIRGKDGVLRGFHNVCQHRAHELLRGRGNAKVITCPYHAWSFHADGRLRTARGAEKMDGFVMQDFDLKPVKVEVFAKHFVFFNLDLQAEALSLMAADLADELTSEIYGFDQLTMTYSGWHSEVKANWKVVVDNFLECYHCRPAHPAFADLVEMDSYKVQARGLWSSQKGKLGRHDNRAYPVAKDEPQQDARFWWLWPCTTFNVLPGSHGVGVFIMAPDGAVNTLQWGQGFAAPGSKPDPLREAYSANVLGPEDVAICESVQRGLASQGYTAGRFIHDPDGSEANEAAVHHFHRLVAQATGLLDEA